MKLIDERDERNRHRKLMKKQYDAVMTLSGERKQYRLLGEGMITYGGGEPWFYLTRGTLGRYVEELASDYVGTVKAGHIDFAEFPDRVVGYWSKADLELKDEEDGRQSLWVTPTLLVENPVLKSLQSLPFAIGTSVEMYTSVNEELTNNETLNPYQVPIIDNVNITDFAFVGDAGDVNCMGVQLKGETKVDFEKLKELLDTEGRSIEEVNQLLSAIDAPVEDEVAPAEEPEQPEEEATEEEPAESAEEEAEKEANEVIEPENDEAEQEDDAVEPEADPEEAEPEEDLAEVLASVRGLMDELRAEVDSLRTENADLRAQLASRDASWADFKKKFSKLAAVRTDNKKPEKPRMSVQYTDGIGE